MEVTPKNDTSKSAYRSPSSPWESRNETPHQKLSASLKARLKRTRRAFTSPFPVAKRLCVDVEDGQPEARPGSEMFSGMIPGPAHTHAENLAQRRERLGRQVKDKTETLRRLRMVKMYRCKNDLTQLQTLIDKWRSCAQNALYELQSDVPVEGRKASLSELIDLFGLDEKILHFDRTEDDFAS
ncbi:swi5-dependent recombination DNA repair protein 1 homolog isoform X2 [Phyllopteryx taeniolatus]|uniref:swi5-dependent recombination DNA repair protein 1 homolog isoform X2 n=1 Tax=Phyllopteryx taeniolatus TaxID=161469 RepID=UPI002AD588C0|nr:swi5-dependent recombination DNA repair protein 1 homolog isoform X2 [Phyllopteryx taeniolatus]